MKRRNKGETLVESLISMFFVITVLVPVSDIFLKTFKVNIKTDIKNSINNENKNIIEILKTKKYDEIINFKGKHSISDLNGFYNVFGIEERYKVLNGKLADDKSKEIEIKQTENFYINEKGDKEYILEISVGNIKDYYFPNLK
jgi:hypothetical protein